jgi:CheY-like chemotaxis protein
MNSFNILLVDDSPVVRAVIGKQLQVLGFSTITADDGQLAVAAVENKHFDLIFMDVMMPNMDGLEATKQIRGLEKTTGCTPTVIVGVTGYTDRTDCIKAGMDDFLFKPVTIEQLKGAIKHWLPEASLSIATPWSQKSSDQDGLLVSASALADQRLAALKLRLGFR